MQNLHLVGFLAELKILHSEVNLIIYTLKCKIKMNKKSTKIGIKTRNSY
jgi:hypothetical protein